MKKNFPIDRRSFFSIFIFSSVVPKERFTIWKQEDFFQIKMFVGGDCPKRVTLIFLEIVFKSVKEEHFKKKTKTHVSFNWWNVYRSQDLNCLNHFYTQVIYIWIVTFFSLPHEFTKCSIIWKWKSNLNHNNKILFFSYFIRKRKKGRKEEGRGRDNREERREGEMEKRCWGCWQT